MPLFQNHDRTSRPEPLKFDFTEQYVVKDLHLLYNTIPIPIQAAADFAAEVSETLDNSVNPRRFHNLMQEQRSKRLDQLSRRFEHVGANAVARPKFLYPDETGEKWRAAVMLFRQQTFTAMLGFWEAMIPEGKWPPDLPLGCYRRDGKAEDPLPLNSAIGAALNNEDFRPRLETSPLRSPTPHREHEDVSPAKTARMANTRSRAPRATSLPKSPLRRSARLANKTEAKARVKKTSRSNRSRKR